MRCLRRNQREFWYALPDGEEEIVNAQGFRTGERRMTFEEPVSMMGNISPARGAAYPELYGLEMPYDRVLVLDDPDTPITETAAVWVRNDPTTDAPHDHIVIRVGRSLNSAVIALKEVKVR